MSRNYPPLTSGVKNLKNKVQRDLPLNRPCHSRFPHSGFLNVYFPPPLRLPSSRISIHLLPSVPPFSSAARGSKLDLEKRDSERALASGKEWNGIYSRRERERERESAASKVIVEKLERIPSVSLFLVPKAPRAFFYQLDLFPFLPRLVLFPPPLFPCARRRRQRRSSATSAHWL